MNKQGGPYTDFLMVHEDPSNLFFSPKAISNLSRPPTFSGAIKEMTLTDPHYRDSVTVWRDENDTLLVTDLLLASKKSDFSK